MECAVTLPITPVAMGIFLLRPIIYHPNLDGFVKSPKRANFHT
jgi:hypothetical protein